MDGTTPISAKDIVHDPDIVLNLEGPYILVRDSSMAGTYKNLIEALNILFELGWESQGLSNDGGGTMYALCRNLRAKRKNEALA